MFKRTYTATAYADGTLTRSGLDCGRLLDATGMCSMSLGCGSALNASHITCLTATIDTVAHIAIRHFHIRVTGNITVITAAKDLFLYDGCIAGQTVLGCLGHGSSYFRSLYPFGSTYFHVSVTDDVSLVATTPDIAYET